jgi:hypothetical protein
MKRKQLLDDLKETRRCWKLKGETLAHTLENSLWKRTWTLRKTDYMIMMTFTYRSR